jgi:hypothetical protein
MGRRRRPENPTPQKTNNSIEGFVENEENECSVPDPNRTMINITNEVSDAHKKSLKEKIMDKITKRSYKTWLTRNSRNIMTPQIKNFRRHRNN